MPDESVTVSIDKLASLAVEHWRLTRGLAPLLQRPDSAGLRHSLRKIEDFLKAYDVEVRSLEGVPYDAGLAARVVDNIVDISLAKGSEVILETVSPLVLRKDQVLRAADVVVAANL